VHRDLPNPKCLIAPSLVNKNVGLRIAKMLNINTNIVIADKIKLFLMNNLYIIYIYCLFLINYKYF